MKVLPSSRPYDFGIPVVFKAMSCFNIIQLYIHRYIMIYDILEMYVCIYTFDMYIYKKMFVLSCHDSVSLFLLPAKIVLMTASTHRCLTGFTRSYRSSTCFAVDLVLGGWCVVG